MLVYVLGGLAAALLASWLLLVVALVLMRQDAASLREAARLLPDALRLLGGLVADRRLPAGVRLRVGLLLAYLALPFDLVPDFIPVVGWADDVLLALLVLRSVVHRAGPEAFRRHWPGTPDGLAAMARLAGLELATTHGAEGGRACGAGAAAPGDANGSGAPPGGRAAVT